MDGPLYNDYYLPELAELSKEGISFSGLSSQGLPTVFGWFSLITGETPYIDTLNMIQSIYNDVDDIPSWFKS